MSAGGVFRSLQGLRTISEATPSTSSRLLIPDSTCTHAVGDRSWPRRRVRASPHHHAYGGTSPAQGTAAFTPLTPISRGVFTPSVLKLLISRAAYDVTPLRVKPRADADREDLYVREIDTDAPSRITTGTTAVLGVDRMCTLTAVTRRVRGSAILDFHPTVDACDDGRCDSSFRPVKKRWPLAGTPIDGPSYTSLCVFGRSIPLAVRAPAYTSASPATCRCAA